MSGQHADATGLVSLAELIHWHVGVWHDLGYQDPPAPGCKTIPPLGQRSASAIEGGRQAIEDIDRLIARLQQVKAQLADELRQDQAIRGSAGA